MRRRRRIRADHEDTNRWLVSYADLVTLLFAFFVVMYAVSSLNENKYKQVAESLEGAFGRMPPPVLAPGQRGAPTGQDFGNPATAMQLGGIAAQLDTLLGPLMKDGQVRIRRDARGLGIEINSKMLFEPASAELSPDNIGILRAIADVLAGEPYDIEIAGHTDNVPITNPAFPSNWELSAMRATAVLRVLAAAGIAGPRLTAIGRGDSLPVATNLTPEGRSRNRRVELTVLAHLPSTPRPLPSNAPHAPATQTKAAGKASS